MKLLPARVGCRIYTNGQIRFARQTGKVIAVNDNPEAVTNHYHIYFENDVWGAIQKREIWLARGDFDVIEEESENGE